MALELATHNIEDAIALQTSKTCVVGFNTGHERMKYCMCVAKDVHKSLTS